MVSGEVAALALAPEASLWQGSRAFRGFWPIPPRPPGRLKPICMSGVRCRSSVVEHSIGNGEVDSSILSGSTSQTIQKIRNLPSTFKALTALVRDQLSRGPLASLNGTNDENACHLAQNWHTKSRFVPASLSMIHRGASKS